MFVLALCFCSLDSWFLLLWSAHVPFQALWGNSLESKGGDLKVGRTGLSTSYLGLYSQSLRFLHFLIIPPGTKPSHTSPVEKTKVNSFWEPETISLSPGNITVGREESWSGSLQLFTWSTTCHCLASRWQPSEASRVQDDSDSRSLTASLTGRFACSLLFSFCRKTLLSLKQAICSLQVPGPCDTRSVANMVAEQGPHTKLSGLYPVPPHFQNLLFVCLFLIIGSLQIYTKVKFTVVYPYMYLA